MKSCLGLALIVLAAACSDEPPGGGSGGSSNGGGGGSGGTGAGGSGSGGSGGVELPPDLEAFAEAFAEAVCARYAACSCGDATDLRCRSQVAGEARARLGPRAASFQPDCGQEVIAAIAADGCRQRAPWERLGLGDACGAYCGLTSGAVPAGGACSGDELHGALLGDCAAGLVCGPDGSCNAACDAWFGDALRPGEACQNGFEVIGSCSTGLGCNYDTDLCTVLPGEGESCLYDLCGPGLWCEVIVATKTCRRLGAHGEACSRPEACVSGSCPVDACVGGDAPGSSCAFVSELLDEPEGCTGDGGCEDFDPCTDDSCAAGLCVFGPPCNEHGSCGGEPRGCSCEPGFDGATCDACRPTHSLEGDRCVPDPDPQRFLLASGWMEPHGEVIAAIDVESGAVHPLLTTSQSESHEITALTLGPDGSLYAVEEGYPKGVIRLDLRTGERQGIVSLIVGGGGYHGANGLAFDETAGVLVGHAFTGAAHYTYLVDPAVGQLEQYGASRDFDAVGLRFDAGAGIVRGIGQRYGAAVELFDFWGPGASATRIPVGVEPGLLQPGLARHPDGRIFISGGRPLTDDEWTREFCRRAAAAFGVPIEGLPFRGGYADEWIGAGDQLLQSDPAGPTVASFGSYGDSSDPPKQIRIATTEAADVICFGSYEQQATVTVAADARFSLLVVANIFAGATVAVEPGFTASGPLAQPIKQVETGGDAPPFTDRPDVVEPIEDTRWEQALRLPSPYVNRNLVITPMLGLLDPVTGEVSAVKDLQGIELHGGLSPVR